MTITTIIRIANEIREIERLSADYKEYVKRKKQKGEKPLPKEKWEIYVNPAGPEAKEERAKADKGKGKKDKGGLPKYMKQQPVKSFVDERVPQDVSAGMGSYEMLAADDAPEDVKESYFKLQEAEVGGASGDKQYGDPVAEDLAKVIKHFKTVDTSEWDEWTGDPEERKNFEKAIKYLEDKLKKEGQG